jgi:hypothetical protein
VREQVLHEAPPEHAAEKIDPAAGGVADGSW